MRPWYGSLPERSTNSAPPRRTSMRVDRDARLRRGGARRSGSGVAAGSGSLSAAAASPGSAGAPPALATQPLDRRVREHVARLGRVERDLAERHLDRLGAAVERHGRLRSSMARLFQPSASSCSGSSNAKSSTPSFPDALQPGRAVHARRDPRRRCTTRIHGIRSGSAARTNSGTLMPCQLTWPSHTRGFRPSWPFSADRALAGLEPEVERERRVGRERDAARLRGAARRSPARRR